MNISFEIPDYVLNEIKQYADYYDDFIILAIRNELFKCRLLDRQINYMIKGEKI